ncbi:hypothetical protein WMF31_34140 [Sorangium sp. So ce1036]|uniref:hypothetical protein n=1 Tax=Sorangium sp. So ce1036 TaxID=3133328 RepID=UPI003F09737E
MRRSALLRRPAFSSVVAIVALLAAGACTQDFDQFEPLLLSGSASAGGAGSGGTATTTASAGAGGAEDCANGDDDDGDGAVDCADESCSGFSCVAIPDGWRGPGLLYDGPASAEIACPAGFSERVDVGGRGVEATATCSPCSCGGPAGACGAPELTAYLDDRCNRRLTSATVPPGECFSFGADLPFESYRAAPPDAASCEASGGEPTGPAPRFRAEGLVCARPPGEDGCDAGEACAPREIDGPFERGVCVYREGDWRCPQGFDERHVFARDMDDRRGCTRCTCDASGVTCTATTTLFDDDECRRQAATVPHDERCLENAPSAVALRVEVAGTGSCQPRGGMPTGEVVEGDDKITVCCAR